MKKYPAITVLTLAALFICATFTKAAAEDFSFRYGGSVIVIPPSDDEDDDAVLEVHLPPVEAQTRDSGPEMTAATPMYELQPVDSEPDFEAYPGSDMVYGTPSTIGGDDDEPAFEGPRDRFRDPDAYIDVSIPDTDTDVDTGTEGDLEVSEPEEPITIVRDRYGEVRPRIPDISRIPDSTTDSDTDSDTDTDVETGTDTTGATDRPASYDNTSSGGRTSGANCPDRPCCRTNCVSSDYAEVPAVIETTANWMAYTGNGGCSLAHTTGASNALPIIILALSLVPMAIRRFCKDK